MALVENRLADAGFVYVGETRLLFHPMPDGSLQLENTRWGRATAKQWAEAVEALRLEYPDRDICP